MRQRWYLMIGAALALGGCGAPAAPPPVTVTVTATVTSIVTPTGVPAGTLVMPSLVGRGLQDAQDELQTLGAFVLDQEDATGQGRLQLVDSNWTVCSQEPTPGSLISVSTRVVLRSVKNEESCP